MSQLLLAYGEDNLYVRNQLLIHKRRGVLRLFFSMVTSMSIMNGLLLSNAIFGTFLYMETRMLYNSKARAMTENRQEKRKLSRENTESAPEYEILYILGHFYEIHSKTKKRMKYVVVQWLGYSPDNGGIEGIPESYLKPNATALLTLYHEFCRKYGNPYMNYEKTKSCKEYLAPGVTGRKNNKHSFSKGKIYELKGFNTLMVNELFKNLENKGLYANVTGFICSQQKIKNEKIFVNKNQLEVLTWRKLCRKWSTSEYTVITHPLGFNGINPYKTKVDMNKLKTHYNDLAEYIPYSAKRFKFLFNSYYNCIKPLIVLLFANGRIAQNHHALVCMISKDDHGFILRYFDPWYNSNQSLTNLLRNTRKEFSYSTTRSFISFGNQSGMDKSCYKRAILIISQLLDGRQIESFGPWIKV